MRLGRALRHRNFRLFFAGQGVSMLGTWITRFAMGYATYALSHSTVQLGLVAFFGQAPTSLVAPLAGVLVDRWDRHRVIVLTQVAALLQSAALAAFALTGTMTVWHLMVLGAVQGVINAFDMPARQSFMRQMVEDRADLPNAIALNSTLVNVGSLLGPAIAALLVAAVGVGACFAVDAVSYLAVIASLLAMRVATPPPRPRPGRVLAEMRAGLAYVRSVPLVFALMVQLAVVVVFGGAYASLLPAVAASVLHGGPHALGWLMSAGGAGALCGALFLAIRASASGLTKIVTRAGVALGAGLVALELAPRVWVAVPMIFVVGMGLMVLWASTNTMVQSLVEEDKLGRVMSLYAVAFFAGAPIGALLLGLVAGAIGPIHAYALGGSGCIVSALAFRRFVARHAPA